MRAIFHPDADEQFARALAYYDGISPDLGRSSLDRIEQSVADIRANPTIDRIFRRPSTRRHHRRGFPYAVVHVLKADYLWLVAVLHFKQRPGYWSQRVENWVRPFESSQADLTARRKHRPRPALARSARNPRWRPSSPGGLSDRGAPEPAAPPPNRTDGAPASGAPIDVSPSGGRSPSPAKTGERTTQRNAFRVAPSSGRSPPHLPRSVRYDPRRIVARRAMFVAV